VDLVARPFGRNLVTGKWIWTHKRGTRLAGFSGVSPSGLALIMMRHSIYSAHGCLACSLSRSWHVHQLDVKNAFLHGTLTETVYCSQLAGFVDSSHSDLVCRLNKFLQFEAGSSGSVLSVCHVLAIIGIHRGQV
jgi:hypothetical protein